MSHMPPLEEKEKKKLIFRPWITLKDGSKLYAWQRGIKAFPIWVDE